MLLSGDISNLDPMPQCGARAEFVFSVLPLRQSIVFALFVYIGQQRASNRRERGN
jgi:hypothetical protein